MVKNKGMQFFYGEFEYEKKKGQLFFALPERRFEPRIFMGSEEDEIESRQGS